MTNWGYTLMTEQSGPRELVHYATQAEALGFDFEASSDHFHIVVGLATLVVAAMRDRGWRADRTAATRASGL